MTQQTFKSAQRRYHRLFWPLMFLYTVMVLLGSFGLDVFDPQPTWLQVVIALACTAPVIATLLVMMRYTEETDEYTRMVQLRSCAWGAVFTVSALFTVGFLQLFGVVDRIDVFWFGPVFFLAYGVSTHLIGGKQCS